MSNMSAPDAISLKGTTKIYGHIATGPEGTVNAGSGTAVGSTTYIDSGGSGIQTDPNHYAKDMNVSFDDVEAPFTGTAPAPDQFVRVDGVFYKYVVGSGNYSLSTLKLTGTNKVLVTGDATLFVDKDVSIGGGALIQINPGASLQLYVKSGDVSLSGGGVVNLTGNAANFALWGMPGLHDIKISGNGQFIGTIYAPNADLQMTGGGTDVLDFIGAAIVKSITGAGHFKVHYDEALARTGPKIHVITSWKEI
jgi:hypothetical protein